MCISFVLTLSTYIAFNVLEVLMSCNLFNAIYIDPVETKHKRVYVMYEATACTQR